MRQGGVVALCADHSTPIHRSASICQVTSASVWCCARPPAHDTLLMFNQPPMQVATHAQQRWLEYQDTLADRARHGSYTYHHHAAAATAGRP